MTGTRAARQRLWRLLSGDRSRQLITCAAAAAQVLLPTLWGPRFAEDVRPPDVIGPAPYTFGVWLPIFAASAGYAGLQAPPARARARSCARSAGRWPPLSPVPVSGPAGENRKILVGPNGFGRNRRLRRSRPPAPCATAAVRSGPGARRRRCGDGRQVGRVGDRCNGGQLGGHAGQQRGSPYRPGPIHPWRRTAARSRSRRCRVHRRNDRFVPAYQQDLCGHRAVESDRCRGGATQQVTKRDDRGGGGGGPRRVGGRA